MTRSRALATSRRLLVALTLSGASALTFEVICIRLLGEAFGHTIYAVQVVLAVFFSGMALGSVVSDRFDAVGRTPLRLYALLECLLAVSALLLPSVVRATTAIYDRHAPWELETGIALLYRLGAASVVLLLPTALMGATFPLIARWHMAHGGSNATVAALYGANTLGGALGAWTCVFLFIPWLGVRGTLGVAAAASVLAAGLTLTLCPATLPRAPSETAATPPAITASALGLLFFLGGFTAIGLEVLWTRALDQVLSGTIYSFATVLATFLVGIALGSGIYQVVGRRSFAFLATVQFVLANAVLASLYLIHFAPRASEALARSLGPGVVSRNIVLESVVSGLLLLVPTACMGILFPLLVDLAVSTRPSAPLGALVAANTVGSTVGPLVSGLVLLPRLEIRGAVLVLAWLAFSVALAIVALARPQLRAWPAVAVGAVSFTLLALAPADVRFWGQPIEVLLDYRDDPAATVAVVADGSSPDARRLKVNNTYSLGGGPALFTELREGHLPMLMHPGPQQVLVLGVGTGNTLGAVALHRPARLVAVELLQGVLDMARRHFGPTNGGVLHGGNATVLCADALRVARATPDRYDLVIADLFHPWQGGVGSLYSLDHFRAVHRTLRPGGILCQWLPIAQLSPESLKTIVRTFLAVYPHSEAWLGNFGTEMPVVALFGSDAPILLRWARWESDLRDPALRAALARARLDHPAELLGGYVGARADLERFAGPGPVNTMDSPLIEFDAPALLFTEAFSPAMITTLEALLRLNARPQVPIATEGATSIPAAEEILANLDAVRGMFEARVAEAKGEPAAALRAALRASRTARGYDVPTAVMLDLVLRWHREQPALAEEALQQVLRAGNADLVLRVASYQLSLGRVDEATVALRRALELRPGWPAALRPLDQLGRLTKTQRVGPFR